MSLSNVHFLGDEKIDGISLVENPFTAAKVRARLRIFAHAPSQVLGFPVNCHFQDKECAPNLSAKNTVLDGFLTRKIVRNPVIQNDQQTKGNLVFVIMDTTRVNGVDLTEENIFDRISTVKVLFLLIFEMFALLKHEISVFYF